MMTEGYHLFIFLLEYLPLGQIANTLLETYRDARYGGIIVRKDKGGKLLIENDSRLNSGTIVVDQGNEIKVIFRESEQPKTQDIMEALAPLVNK